MKTKTASASAALRRDPSASAALWRDRRGSRRESAVAHLFSLASLSTTRDLIVHKPKQNPKYMRILIITSWLALVAPVLSYAAGDTNEFTLFTYRVDGQKFEWRISQSRLIATPAWSPDSQSVPLTPDKAWQIARDWSQAHGYSKPHLVMIWIQPFSTPKMSNDAHGRFYYRVACSSPEHSESSCVVILMDGTVLESHQVTEAATSNLDNIKLKP